MKCWTSKKVLVWVGNTEEEYSLILKCKLFISLVKYTVYVSRAAAGWKPVFILCNSFKVLTELRPRTVYLSLCSTVYQNVKNLIAAWKLLSSSWQILVLFLCILLFQHYPLKLFFLGYPLAVMSTLLVFSSFGGYFLCYTCLCELKSFGCRKWRLGLP